MRTARGVVVEAELGKPRRRRGRGQGGRGRRLLHPARKRWRSSFRKTGVDSLAIAIGTSHGAYKFKGEAKLRFDILEEVEPSACPAFPIVLHGASSVVPEFVEMINKYGGKMPGAQGRAGGHAAPGGKERGVQDQHRLRPAARDDGDDPQAFCGAIRRTSTRDSI